MDECIFYTSCVKMQIIRCRVIFSQYRWFSDIFEENGDKQTINNFRLVCLLDILGACSCLPDAYFAHQVTSGFLLGFPPLWVGRGHRGGTEGGVRVLYV